LQDCDRIRKLPKRPARVSGGVRRSIDLHLKISVRPLRGAALRLPKPHVTRPICRTSRKATCCRGTSIEPYGLVSAVHLTKRRFTHL
jgi:hypothetical protein